MIMTIFPDVLKLSRELYTDNDDNDENYDNDDNDHFT